MIAHLDQTGEDALTTVDNAGRLAE